MMSDLFLCEDVRESGTASLMSTPIPRVLPRVKLCGSTLWCEDEPLSLERKPLTKKLFEAFLRAPEKPLSREDLAYYIYNETFRPVRSTRYWNALSQNVVKLVSRARQLAEEAFCGENMWMEWFVYNADRETWSLFRLSHSYLQQKERQWR